MSKSDVCNLFSRELLTVLALLLAPLVRADVAPLAVNPGPYLVTTTLPTGDGSLLQAIESANSDGQTSEIRFQISGPPPHVIRPFPDLPALMEPTVITGPTNADGTPQVVLERDSLSQGPTGLQLAADGCVVRGLNLRGWETGIDVSGTGCTIQGCHFGQAQFFNHVSIYVQANETNIGGTLAGEGNVISGGLTGIHIHSGIGHRILGNRIGTDPTGTQDLGLTRGIFVGGAAAFIGRDDPGSGNLISGNFLGIQVASTGGAIIRGNIIGLAADGQSALPNDTGIALAAANDCIIGGSTPGARNVISGNTGSGIRVLTADRTRNAIRGNYIGTDVTGTRAIGNQIGVEISDAQLTVVGGENPGEGNVISGNRQFGVLHLSGPSNVILANRIGTDVTGLQALPNGSDGVHINVCNITLVGGTTPGLGNLISGNGGDGIHISSGTNGLIAGNLIGVDATGVRPLGNQGHGIYMNCELTNVGGYSSPEGNVIGANGGHGILIDQLQNNLVQHNRIGIGADLRTPLGNGGDGVRVQSANLIRVRQNFIANNGGIGLDLGGNSVTLNDFDDSDVGPNALQNFPELNTVTFDTSPPRCSGSLHSVPNTLFTIDLYVSESPDPIGFGEGAYPIGSFMLGTNGAGTAAFLVNIDPVPPGRYVSATATSSLGNTSEFSVWIRGTGREPSPLETVDFLVGRIPDPGDLDLNGDAVIDVADLTFLVNATQP